LAKVCKVTKRVNGLAITDVDNTRLIQGTAFAEKLLETVDEASVSNLSSEVLATTSRSNHLLKHSCSIVLNACIAQIRTTQLELATHSMAQSVNIGVTCGIKVCSVHPRTLITSTQITGGSNIEVRDYGQLGLWLRAWATYIAGRIT
jgi:hypothetical protein